MGSRRVTVALNLNSHLHGFYFKFDIYEQCFDLIFSLTSSHSHIMQPFHSVLHILMYICMVESEENINAMYVFPSIRL